MLYLYNAGENYTFSQFLQHFTSTFCTNFFSKNIIQPSTKGAIQIIRDIQKSAKKWHVFFKWPLKAMQNHFLWKCCLYNIGENWTLSSALKSSKSPTGLVNISHFVRSVKNNKTIKKTLDKLSNCSKQMTHHNVPYGTPVWTSWTSSNGTSGW